jgi:hypothetical protein
MWLHHLTYSPDGRPSDFDPFGMLNESSKIVPRALSKCNELNRKWIQFWGAFHERNWFQFFGRGSEDYSKFLIAVGSISKGLAFDLFGIQQFIWHIASMDSFRTPDILYFRVHMSYCGLWIVDCGLWIVDCRFRISYSRLRFEIWDFVFHILYFVFHISYFIFHISYAVFQIPNSNRNSNFKFHTPHSTLHTPHSNSKLQSKFQIPIPTSNSRL